LIGGTPKVINTDDYPHDYPLKLVQGLLASFQKSYSSGMKTFTKLMYPEPGTEYLAALGYKIFQKTTPEIAINSLSNHFKEDVRSLLGKINIPTLIIHGGKRPSGYIGWR
jgi:pimeloyl-ACP methyl ester carboxylesterase